MLDTSDSADYFRFMRLLVEEESECKECGAKSRPKLIEDTQMRIMMRDQRKLRVNLGDVVKTVRVSLHRLPEHQGVPQPTAISLAKLQIRPRSPTPSASRTLSLPFYFTVKQVEGQSRREFRPDWKMPDCMCTEQERDLVVNLKLTRAPVFLIVNIKRQTSQNHISKKIMLLPIRSVLEVAGRNYLVVAILKVSNTLARAHYTTLLRVKCTLESEWKEMDDDKVERVAASEVERVTAVQIVLQRLAPDFVTDEASNDQSVVDGRGKGKGKGKAPG